MIIPSITRKNHQDIKSEKVIDPFDEKIIDIMFEWGTLSDRLHRFKAITWFESYFSESNSNYLNARSDGGFDI